MSSLTEISQIIIALMPGILVPTALPMIGNWSTQQSDRAEAHHIDCVALLLGHLVSSKPRECLLALQVLRYLDLHSEFPHELTVNKSRQ